MRGPEVNALLGGMENTMLRVRKMTLAAMMTLALAAALGLGGCSLFTPSLSEDTQSAVAKTDIASSALVAEGKLTVALDTTNAPQAMTNQDGSIGGYQADLARSIAQHFGLEVAFVDSASAEDALTLGEADIYLGATSDDASSKVKVMGDVLEDACAVFGKSDSGNATVSASDLSSATIGVQMSSASQDALSRAGINAQQKTYTNVNECFAALESGEVQYVACDMTAGSYLSRAYSDISFAGTIGSVSKYGVAVLSKNNELAEKVGKVIDTICSDGTLDAIHTLWYGSAPTSLSNALISGLTISEQDSGNNSDDAVEDAAGDSSNSESVAAEEQPLTVDINDVNR